jgi:DNA processing protein
MSTLLSTNTQAILLLTAPLIVGREDRSRDLLTPVEYRRLAQFLREKNLQPGDLLDPNVQELNWKRHQPFDSNRLNRLLDRGFLLSQAIERWQARAIWVTSRADAAYPMRLKTRLKEDAPSVLYGCGDIAILNTTGLAVVGSRHVEDELVVYAEEIGGLVARASRTVVSGGARGIDQAAMRGALEAGGKVVGVLADSLERAAINRDNRNFLMDEQLVLISPYDPVVGFNVGHAMQRNKLIYALAEAALVVSSDHEKGGTWTGAVEQIEKLHLVPVYVRSNGVTSAGLKALSHKGALPWPNPNTPEALAAVLAVDAGLTQSAGRQSELFHSVREKPRQTYEVQQSARGVNESSRRLPKEPRLAPADELFAKVRELVERIKTPQSEAQVAADLQVSKSQARLWLQRLVREGVIERHIKPVRYGPKSQGSLLG